MRCRGFDTQYKSLRESIPGGPQLHCRFVVQSSHPGLFGVVCKYWALKISGSFRFRLLTAEARCEKVRAGKADRFVVQAVTQNCECEAVGHQTISANPSSWRLGGEIPQIWTGRRTGPLSLVMPSCCCWNCRRLVQRREVHPRKRAHLVIESLKPCRVVQWQILSFHVSWAQRSRSREA